MAGRKDSTRPLDAYVAKRDFTRTPEPTGKTKPKAAERSARLSFCVQKHLASHLHYDFRLEHRGVLLSWAVPKGPSLNPADKRMAVRTEDHPLDYGSFEGVIPAGYGAGVVLLWDRGTWEPEAKTADVDAALAKGEIKFRLDGVKLKGSWVLVRTRRKSPSPGPEQWLLIKHRDSWSGEVDVTASLPQSVRSFGDLPDVLAAHGPVAEWKAAPPVRGGETGKLFADVIAKAAEARAGKAKSAARGGTKSKAPKRVKQAAKATPPAPRNTKVPGVPKSALTFSGNKPKLSNPTKVLFPKSGFTKGDLVNYYTTIAPLILPHLAGRAVTLKRFPDGVDGKFFFEKRCNAHRPDWVRTVRVVGRSAKEKTIDFCEIADLSTLVWAANLAAIELHTSLALAADPECPTALVFDLDPGPPATIADCVPVALRLKALLDQLKLQSLIKTSGSKGLHVLVPLNSPGVTFDDTKPFARAVAMTLERDEPTKVIASMAKAGRAGKVFIDWGQNDRNKTTVCVFSVRARQEPTVSWPLAWDRLEAGAAGTPIQASDPPDRREAERLLALMGRRQRLPQFGK